MQTREESIGQTGEEPVETRHHLLHFSPECFTNRTHAQHHVQLVLHPRREEIEQGLWRAVGLSEAVPLTVNDPHLLAYLHFLVVGKQIWNLAGIQQIIHVLQKGFIFDLRIRKDEHRVLFCLGGFPQNAFQIVPPFIYAVVL